MTGRAFALSLLLFCVVRGAPGGAPPDSLHGRPGDLILPADAAQNLAARPLFLWHSTGDSLRYRIRIGHDSLLLRQVVDDSLLIDTTFRPRSALQNDSLYYWRVEVSDSSGGWKESETRSFRIAPAILLSATELAFGLMRRDDSTTVSFEIRNPVPRPVTIDSAWSGSGRFRLITPLPALIDSLDTLQLVAGFFPVEYIQLADTLRFLTELGDTLLRVTGDSPPPLAEAGNSKIVFAPAAIGDTSFRSVTLYNRGGINTLTVARLRLRQRTMQVLTRTPLRIAPRDSAVVRLRFVPGAVRSAPYGEIVDTLIAETDGGELRVECSGEHPAPRLVAIPRSIDFGSLALGDSLRNRVAVAAGSISPLRIDSVRVGTAAFRVSSIRRTLRGRDTLSLWVRCNPPRYGIWVDTLDLFSNALPPVARIPLRGTAPPPLLAADQKSLAFGDVPVRETARMVVGISNGSINGLVIDSITTKTRRFQVEKFPQFTSIRQGDTLRVGVTFTPDTGLVFRDTLLIYNNSPTPRWRIPCSGSGKGVAGDASSSGSFALLQNYPNPFTGTTTFRYMLPERCAVRLLVYNSLGQVIAVVVDGEEEGGFHSVPWRAETASGMYFFRMIATSLVSPDRQYQATKRLMIIR